MKNCLKIIIKSFLLLCILLVTWLGLTEFFRVDVDKAGDQFRNLPKNSMDVLVLGSSHAQYSMNPAIIYQETGYYSYVLGSGCQPMAMSYKFLEEALKTQSPEIVVLDVFTMMPAQEVCYSDGMFYKAIQQMTGINRYEAAALVDNENVKLDYMFDLRMNHGNWKRDDFLGPRKKVTGVDPYFGYVLKIPDDFRFAHLIPYEKKSDYTLRQKDVDMLNLIIKTCKENNIQLILMKAPITIDQKNQDALEAIWEYADSKGIEHIDFLALAEEIGFTMGMDGDTWHNNIWGSEKISKYIANYIAENKYVKNHTENQELNEIYKKTSAEMMGYLCTNQIDVYKLLEFAAKYDCMIAFKYEGNNHSSIGQYENELLQNVGLDHDFIKNKKQDYYALIHNGEIVFESNTPIQRKYNGVSYEIMDNEIIIGDQTFDDLGELEIIFFDENMGWYQDIDIDYASRFFWKNGCNGWECEE
ncbi:MAG: hypothetical protein RR925_06235 [Erysipelotrichaceae bacterium]